MFLELNGIDVTSVANDVVFELVITVAASDLDVEEIAAPLQQAGNGRMPEQESSS